MVSVITWAPKAQAIKGKTDFLKFKNFVKFKETITGRKYLQIRALIRDQYPENTPTTQQKEMKEHNSKLDKELQYTFLPRQTINKM